MKKKTVEQFIEEANRVHNHKFDYGKTVYINTRTKVKIICPTHGEFEQRPSEHLDGSDCCKCSNPHRIRLTTEQFIERANIFHNHKFDYSLVVYKGYDSSIKIICPKHGLFECLPSNHIRDPISCPKCIGDNHRKLFTKSNEYYIIDAKKIHGNIYDYSLVNYINNESKVTIICPIHGEFKQKATNHLSGHGCPLCKKSKGELKIVKLLNENNVDFIPQKTFDDCRGIKNKLSFDFYLPSFNAVIEFDGRHHFEEIKRWGGSNKLSITQASDAIKNAYCKANKIKIIRIRYDEDITQRVQEFLDWGNTLDFHWE